MISVTDITTHLFCPRKLYLSKILKLTEPLNSNIILGGIKHSILENLPSLDKELATQLTPKIPINTFVTAYNLKAKILLHKTITKRKHLLRQVGLSLDTALTHTRQIITTHTTQRATQLHTFAHHHQLFETNLWNAYIPKEKTEYTVSSERLQLKGRIDSLHIYPTSIIPVEHKSGKPPQEGAWDNHKLQVAAYALLLEDNFNTPINTGIVHYIDTGQAHTIHINPFMKDNIKQQTKTVINTLQKPTPPPVLDNPSKCKNCGYYPHCYNKA